MTTLQNIIKEGGEKFDKEFVSYKDVYDPKDFKKESNVWRPSKTIDIWKRKPSPYTVKSFISSLLTKERAKLISKIDSICAEFGDNPAECLAILGEHLHGRKEENHDY